MQAIDCQLSYRTSWYFADRPRKSTNRQLLFVRTAIACRLPASKVLAQAPSKDSSSEQAKFYSSENIEWKDGPAGHPKGSKWPCWKAIPERRAFRDALSLPGRLPHSTSHPSQDGAGNLAFGRFIPRHGGQTSRSSAQMLAAGTYGFWPPVMKHAGWADSETVIQLHGTGPWAIKYLNPADDPRAGKKPL